MKNLVRLRPLHDWIVVQPLSPDEVSKIERSKKEAPVSLILLAEKPREYGEQSDVFKWCKVLAVHDDYEDVNPGDVVFCNTISGSHGVNSDFQSIDGVKFLQMPTKDVMGVLE